MTRSGFETTWPYKLFSLYRVFVTKYMLQLNISRLDLSASAARLHICVHVTAQKPKPCWVAAQEVREREALQPLQSL